MKSNFHWCVMFYPQIFCGSAHWRVGFHPLHYHLQSLQEYNDIHYDHITIKKILITCILSGNDKGQSYEDGTLPTGNQGMIMTNTTQLNAKKQRLQKTTDIYSN